MTAPTHPVLQQQLLDIVNDERFGGSWIEYGVIESIYAHSYRPHFLALLNGHRHALNGEGDHSRTMSHIISNGALSRMRREQVDLRHQRHRQDSRPDPPMLPPLTVGPKLMNIESTRSRWDPKSRPNRRPTTDSEPAVLCQSSLSVSHEDVRAGFLATDVCLSDADLWLSAAHDPP
jgi:hypothetical protein